MQKSTVAGIYIERHRATMLGATYDPKDAFSPVGPQLTFTAYDERKWSPKNRDQALSELRLLARDVADKMPEVRSIALAGFGPFVSLKRTDRGHFGRVHPLFGHEPFKDVRLYHLFAEELSEVGLSRLPLITVHTDANAFAIGEAMARDIPADHVMVSVLVTEGVGGGIVTGRSSFESALHPEMGLLHPRYDKDDKLKPEKSSHLFSHSIADLADNEALRKRCIHEYGHVDFPNISDPKMWEMRAYYISQVCFSCTAILAPHHIVVAADIDPHNRLVPDTRRFFGYFMDNREGRGAPLLDYAELDDTHSFISAPQRLPFAELDGLPTSLALTGAAGMCLAAARVRRGGDNVTDMREAS